jgi:hypothetical protein
MQTDFFFRQWFNIFLKLIFLQGDQKVSVHQMITVQKTHKIF